MRLTTRDYSFSVKEMTDAGIFTGYGSVFGVIDSYNEVVAPGAFVESLSAHKAKGTVPALLWQHRSGEPIGTFTSMEEDTIGLKVTGRIAMKTQRGAEAYELLKMGAISGLSIGFIPRDDSYDQKTGITTLKKVDLWETSLVTFPANDAARIQGVKGIDEFKDLQSVEQYLREAGGFSRSEVRAIIHRIKSLNQCDADEDTKKQLLKNISTLSN